MSDKIEVYDEQDKGWMHFEASVAGLAAGYFAWMNYNLHGGEAVLTGFGTWLAYLMLYSTRVGFAILCIVSVGLWAGGAFFLTEALTDGDRTWAWCAAILAAFVVLGSHVRSKRYTDNVDD
jgi:hypothetical protein